MQDESESRYQTFLERAWQDIAAAAASANVAVLGTERVVDD